MLGGLPQQQMMMQFWQAQQQRMQLDPTAAAAATAMAAVPKAAPALPDTSSIPSKASAPAPVATTLSGLLGVASLPPVAPSITAPHTAPHVAHVPALAQTAGAALSAAMTQEVKVQDPMGQILPSFSGYDSFDACPFPAAIKNQITAAGFPAPSQIQQPLAMQNLDVIGVAATGSGKTLAFLLPAFTDILTKGVAAGDPSLLVIAPTRELAIQIQEESDKFGRAAGIRTVCCYGGAPKPPQADQIRMGVHGVVGTPGRIQDFCEGGQLRLGRADRMLDMGFEPQIRKILMQIPRQRQTLFFTATWPMGVRKLASEFLNGPYTAGVADRSNTAAKGLIFCSTKRLCNQLSEQLERQGVPCSAVHGDKGQREREAALSGLKEGRLKLLVATDVAARGLDIKGVTLVVNFDAPSNTEDYVHRIGRTGRAGQKGHAVTLINDRDAHALRGIVEVMRRTNQEVTPQVEEMLRSRRNERRVGRERVEAIQSVVCFCILSLPPRRAGPAPPPMRRHGRGKGGDDFFSGGGHGGGLGHGGGRPSGPGLADLPPREPEPIVHRPPTMPDRAPPPGGEQELTGTHRAPPPPASSDQRIGHRSSPGPSLKASCRVLSSSQEGLQSLVTTLRLEDSNTAAKVMSLCAEVTRRVKREVSAHERSLLQTYGFPFVEGADPKADILNFLVIIGLLVLLTILWECLVLRSSMVWCARLDLGGVLANILHQKEQQEDGTIVVSTSISSTPPSKKSETMSEEEIQEAWRNLRQHKVVTPEEPKGNEVGFEHLNFTGKASDGEVVVRLVRSGSAEGELQVRIGPSESKLEQADDVADNGKDAPGLVTFKDSEVEVEVKIQLQPPRTYKTTQYFEIDLLEVVKGKATLGGPSLARESHRRTVRVYISYDYAFPYNIPTAKQKSRFWVIWYYLQEICVPLWILLDQICDPDIPGDKPLEICMMGLAQFASAALLRFGDKLAVENRGRTGGTRMVHRKQLFAKLLMLDAEEWRLNPKVVVQASKVMQAGGNGWGETMQNLAGPGVGQLVMVLLCFGLLRRANRLGDLLFHRMAGEAAWVDSFSWLCRWPRLVLRPTRLVVGSTRKTAPDLRRDGDVKSVVIGSGSHAGLPLKSLASRICSRVDLRFLNETKYFVSYHKSSRDWSNDTLWLVKWMINLAYISVLVLGAKSLLENRELGSSDFQSGDFVFQLKIFSSFGKYLVKIVQSFIKMYSASVGLQQFAEIMNWPERSLSQSTKEGRVMHDVTTSEIIFETEAEDEDQGRALPLVPLSRVVRKALRIPLGRVVRVTSQRERYLLNFLYQVSELKAPRRGKVRRPQGVRITFIPAELKADVEKHPEVLKRLLMMFEWDPDETTLGVDDVGRRWRTKGLLTLAS
eukprot:g12283.t1